MPPALPSHHPLHPLRSRRRILERVALAGAVTMFGSAAVAMEAAEEPEQPDVRTRVIAVVPEDRIDLNVDTMAVPDMLDEALVSRASLEAVEPVPEPRAQPVATVSNNRGQTWDRLADCESGQDWAINTGNGYYGGLQFDKSSWDWAGGERFSDYPHHASRSQQIEIAERLLAIHPAGWGAWPACSARLGLN